MPKTVTSHTLQLVTFSTILPFSEVTSRLDAQIGKETVLSLPVLTSGAATSIEAFEAHVKSRVGPSGFLYFNEHNHGGWMKLFSSSRRAVLYVLGNPLVGQTFLQYDLRGALNIPPRVLVLETADGAGTEVVYHLPSSLIALDDNEKLRAAAEGLDSKLEALVESITAA
ncbi:hypothetical protein C8R45DRAFT_1087090 [Mycena sanguinolenta]|nr:hypothetical protein C8R45DRAFT_1087090 [Mycena sanguinolenta]